jgi:hypothetical protein
MDIKTDIPLMITEAKKENETAKKNQIKIESSTSTPDGKSLESNNLKSPEGNSEPWSHTYSIGAGYSLYNVEVKDSRIGIETLNIKNELSLLKVEGVMTTTTPYSKVIKLRGKFSYFSIRTEDDVELDDFYEFGIFAGMESGKFKFYTGFSTETLVFGSVPTIGDGIRPSTINNYNLQLWAAYSISHYEASISISRVFISANNSDHEISTSNATSLNIELMATRQIIEFTKNLLVYTSLEQKHYSNEIDIDISSSRISFGASYRF